MKDKIIIVVKGGTVCSVFVQGLFGVEIIDLDQTDDADKRDRDEARVNQLEKDSEWKEIA